MAGDATHDSEREILLILSLFPTPIFQAEVHPLLAQPITHRKFFTSFFLLGCLLDPFSLWLPLGFSLCFLFMSISAGHVYASAVPLMSSREREKWLVT
ncbi:hypothetical protein CEXT_81111 [Caerostris extrusa]|uniref:Uncharacterized protein n=1 Tax=Caerostris extrusa TaxID=172846 RepID=A0AAV4S903_CAEEX|nr:hypothetical protein CEXT_81111 [Caerostris extrusa]